MSVAQDITSGQLDPEQLEAAAVQACREAVGTVIGPGDPVWPVQVSIVRDVLAVGGAVSADELAEWAAVERSREEPSSTGRSWIEQALALDAGEEDDGER
ncbi:flagellar hook-length control protein [Mycobacterium barrassiae]|uniref:flagellar hook-length control protein n=1 Tax=Mycobacterium barrassiae TaxID=319709 RepID=UPI002265991C|nr:flagellar hook-length control protein [Mycobacterium barrassiae]